MEKNPYPGKFIVFEGLDGSGQTTQSSILEKYTAGMGIKTILTKEPTKESAAGMEIREVLGHKKEISPEELQKLFAEDRKEHLKKTIIPALKEGNAVISDRYFFSSLAFGSLECDLEWLISINNNFLLPDATFVLMVKPETSVERISKRGLETTLFEKLDKLRKVAENYRKFEGRFENLFFIDGDRPIEEIHKEIAEKVTGILK